MIDDKSLPLVHALWPTFRAFGQRYSVDPKLLLALGYIQSGLDSSERSSAGALGVMQMMPATADEVARQLGRGSYNLTDSITAIEFASAYLGRLLKVFGMPRLAVAAYVAGPGAVQKAGGQVPDDRDTQRVVRNVMAVFGWLGEHLAEVLDSSENVPMPTGMHTTTDSTGQPLTLPGGSTSTAAVGTSTVLSAPQWRLIAPPTNWQQPIAIEASAIPMLEQLATQLALVYRRDDDQKKVYLGVHGATTTSTSTPQSRGRLILPIAGLTAANDGSYPLDTGIDLLVPYGTPVRAAGAGKIVYSEHGHTPWTTPPDTPNSILIRLDNPFVYQGREYGLTWFTHLSRLRFEVPDGSPDGPHVEQGELIGWTGTGNRVNHLHMGVAWDRAQSLVVPPLALSAYFGLRR